MHPAAAAGLNPLQPGARVLVAGAGVTGASVLAALAPLGVAVDLTDDREEARVAAGKNAAAAGARVIEPATAIARIADYVLVVTSPGLPPSAPMLIAALGAGVPVWGDVELAWRLDRSGRTGPPRQWLVVTGTNGKTTTTSMLHAMLTAAGRTGSLCGNIGEPVVDALGSPGEYLAVELSSFQLYWSASLRPDAGAVLNVAEDHLDWHGSLDDYAAAKARALDARVAVAGLDDPIASDLLRACRAPVKVGFRLGEPGPGELGVLDALAAAALARAVAVPAEAIAAALRSFRVGRHRAEVVATLDGVTYVDDSKATNPHAARASVLAYPRVVWLAGGLLKGASVDEMLPEIADRLAGAVLIGRDRDVVAKALSRHAPDVPVIQVVTGEDAGVHETTESSVTRVIRAPGAAVGTAVMTAAVAAARELAGPGDTVLLAPAGASFDQFGGYADRGECFAAAVRALETAPR
jgi:UDP-N-acetylmuramoylalanine--D-glutamate ligase